MSDNQICRIEWMEWIDRSIGLGAFGECDLLAKMVVVALRVCRGSSDDGMKPHERGCDGGRATQMIK
jgi:hypothetical protein